MFWAATVLLLSTQVDPRPEIAQYQIEGRTAEALSVIEASLAAQEEETRPLGLDYLRGHLLEALGRDRAAHEAFAQSLSTAMPLAPYGRFRLALNQERQGHPEVSAGLLATLLASRPPKRLVRPSVEMLSQAIEGGADCRLLSASDRWRLEQRPRRRIELAKASCDLEDNRVDDAIARLTAILDHGVTDEAARLAAERLSTLVGDDINPATALLLGRAFHNHRRFDLSTLYLRKGLAELEGVDLEARYALARSLFWRSEYLLAASEFGQVAATTSRPGDKARALYQQARSFELNGNWDAAEASYRFTYLAEPDGQWADAALLSALRIEWRRGAEAPALELYEVLASKRGWSRLFEAASVFLASSEIVRGRSERAGAWLDRAKRARHESSIDTTYWSGRLAELEGDHERATDLYLDILSHDPFHPLAQGAARRLRAPALQNVAAQLGLRLARGNSTSALYGAALLLPADHAESIVARRRLTERLAARSSARPFLEIARPDPLQWPMWQANLDRPEEMLLALGVWNYGEPAVLEHFSVNDPGLALTAVRELERAGSLRSALRIAEIVYQRAVAEVPVDMLSTSLRRAAFPLHYGDLIAERSGRFGVDPFLLAAIVREESRFDAGAVSAAAARGLAQFVLPTAERLGIKVGLETVSAEDLHRPEVALTLGAAYLQELGRLFVAQPYAVVAAYNAGENQASLWQAYCFSLEPDEYFSKVGFPETRGYLEKVLASRKHYALLYGPESESEATPRTASGAGSANGSK